MRVFGGARREQLLAGWQGGARRGFAYGPFVYPTKRK
jgi:hypothetical protein